MTPVGSSLRWFSQISSGIGSWLALTRSFVAGFLFLFTLRLLCVLLVMTRWSYSGAMVGKFDLRCIWWPHVSQNFLLLCLIYGTRVLRLFLSPFVCRSGGVALRFLSPHLIKLWGFGGGGRWLSTLSGSRSRVNCGVVWVRR